MGLFHSLSAGNTIFITPWRHLKDKGGPIVDMGVHMADQIRYQLGDIAEVYGDVWLVEPVRRKAGQHWRHLHLLPESASGDGHRSSSDGGGYLNGDIQDGKWRDCKLVNQPGRHRQLWR